VPHTRRPRPTKRASKSRTALRRYGTACAESPVPSARHPGRLPHWSDRFRASLPCQAGVTSFASACSGAASRRNHRVPAGLLSTGGPAAGRRSDLPASRGIVRRDRRGRAIARPLRAVGRPARTQRRGRDGGVARPHPDTRRARPIRRRRWLHTATPEPGRSWLVSSPRPSPRCARASS